MISKKHFIEELELFHKDMAVGLIARIGKENSRVLLKRLELYKNAVIKIAENQNIVATPAEWIPCSERLPEPFVNVLIFTDDGTFDVACKGYSYLDIDDIWKPVGGGYRKQENVIAWMELPEPYKGE